MKGGNIKGSEKVTVLPNLKQGKGKRKKKGEGQTNKQKNRKQYYIIVILQSDNTKAI